MVQITTATFSWFTAVWNSSKLHTGIPLDYSWCRLVKTPQMTANLLIDQHLQVNWSEISPQFKKLKIQSVAHSAILLGAAQPISNRYRIFQH